MKDPDRKLRNLHGLCYVVATAFRLEGHHQVVFHLREALRSIEMARLALREETRRARERAVLDVDQGAPSCGVSVPGDGDRDGTGQAAVRGDRTEGGTEAAEGRET